MTTPTQNPAPGADAPLVLHGDAFSISPYFFTCWVALCEKGLPFDVREVHLERDENHAAAYRDASLTGRVPTLRHGDFWLAESSAIVDYLDEAFPPPAHPALLPADMRARAQARMVLAWVRSDLLPIRAERSTATMFYERAKAPLSTTAEEARATLLHVADKLVPEAGGLFGAFSIADADLAFMLQRLILNGDALPAKLHRFADLVWSRPSVRTFVDHHRAPYVAY